LTALSIGGALTGAAWTTGLAVIARGWRPRISVLGGQRWQVLLIEHGSCRVLVVHGQFEESPEPAVDLLCGVLRQHIDVVAGTGDALASLSSGFRTRRAVRTFVELDPPPGTTGSPAYVRLFEGITIDAGTMEITLQPLAADAWSSGTEGSRSWIGHVTVRELAVAFAPTVEIVADHGSPRAALAIAPEGDAGRLWRSLPGITIATNAREPLATMRASLADHVPVTLVRTFPRDIAVFEFRDARLTLPDWEERAARGAIES